MNSSQRAACWDTKNTWWLPAKPRTRQRRSESCKRNLYGNVEEDGVAGLSCVKVMPWRACLCLWLSTLTPPHTLSKVWSQNVDKARWKKACWLRPRRGIKFAESLAQWCGSGDFQPLLLFRDSNNKRKNGSPADTDLRDLFLCSPLLSCLYFLRALTGC